MTGGETCEIDPGLLTGFTGKRANDLNIVTATLYKPGE